MSPRDPGALATLLDERLRASGVLSFHDFMRAALYEPGLGYYARAGATTGSEGDFVTSADVSSAYGRTLARQAAEVFRLAGGGAWRLLELGPGRGLLAADLLEGLATQHPEAFAALEELLFVEASPTMRARVAERLEALDRRLRAAALRALPPLRLVEESVALEADERTLFAYANELLDALPVHALVRRDGMLRELVVARGDEGRLELREGDEAPASLRALAERYGLCPREGDRAELCPHFAPLLAELGRLVRRGALLFADYGHEAARLADEEHAAGTLVAYRGHAVVFDVLADPGEQDITAHVNWDHVEDAGRDAGFEVAGRVPQDRFLLALGFAEELLAPAEGAPEPPRALAERLAARRLVMPGAGGGGRRFQVLALTRDLAGGLSGLADPCADLAPPAPSTRGAPASSKGDDRVRRVPRHPRPKR